MDALFAELARQALLAIKVEDVARFLGKRLPLNYDTQVNSHLGRRHAGLRLKHSFGPASVKLYNRPGGILRLEMTTYDVSFFRHYRQVVHQDGTKEQMLATMKKSIYSLPDLAELMQAGVHRYSQWLAGLAEHTAGHRDITRLGRPEHDAQGRRILPVWAVRSMTPKVAVTVASTPFWRRTNGCSKSCCAENMRWSD
jgi:hypothetical protein